MNSPDLPSRSVDKAAESVAGEEDPGALDAETAATMQAGVAHANRAARPAQAAAGGTPDPSGNPPLAPADEAPPGTPGTGEGICPRCGGSGRIEGGACPECQGTGKVTVGIGGA